MRSFSIAPSPACGIAFERACGQAFAQRVAGIAGDADEAERHRLPWSGTRTAAASIRSSVASIGAGFAQLLGRHRPARVQEMQFVGRIGVNWGHGSQNRNFEGELTQRDTMLPLSVAFGHMVSRSGSTDMSGQAMEMETRQRANPTGVLEEMKRLAVEQLGGVPSALYAPVAEALDDAAQRAGLIQIRRGDHIALLNLRQRNAGNVMRYRQLIAQGFEDFRALPNRMRNGQPLGLVEDRHLGFHYAGQKLAESIGQRFVRQLEMLDQRLEALAARTRGQLLVQPDRRHAPGRCVPGDLPRRRPAGNAAPAAVPPIRTRTLARAGRPYGRINTLLAPPAMG